jgi:hypothetical protein
MSGPGPAYAYNTANGASSAVSSQTYGVPLLAEYKRTEAVSTKPTGRWVAAGQPAAAVAEPVIAAEPMMSDKRNSLMWGIVILGLFVFIFGVTIMILLFTISFENNQIASTILAGLSALFAVIMVALMYQYDRLTFRPLNETVAYATTPAPAYTMPMASAPPAVEMAVPQQQQAPAPAPPAERIAAPGGPETAGYYYGAPHYGGQMHRQPRYNYYPN